MVQNFFEDRDYLRYGIEIFEQKNIPIEVWSVVYLVATAENIVPLQKYTEKMKVYYPTSFLELTEKIRANRNNIFMLNLNFYDKGKSIRKVIYKNKCIYFELKICPPLCYAEELARGSMGRRFFLLRKVARKDFFRTLKYLLESYNLKRIFDVKFYILMILNRPKNIFYSTEYDCCHIPLVARLCKSYSIHTLDYDIYLNHVNNERVNKDYIVYLDDAETIPQADLVNYELDTLNREWVEIHRADVCNLLDKVEKVYGQRIIVAGHPRVTYQGEEYGKREIVQFKTGELVQNSSLVIVSRSTAWNFISLYDKPVLFYTTSRKPYREDIEVMERYFKRPAFDIANENITDEMLTMNIRKIDGECRKRYLEEYVLGKDNQDELFFETVAHVLDKYVSTE